MWSASACRQARRALRGASRIATSLHRPLQLPLPTPLPLSVPVLHKNYAVRAIQNNNIDPLLQRIDEDVRRNGRLTLKDLKEVLKVIQIQKHITSSHALLVIRCCGELVPEELPAERTKLVDQIWKTFSNKQVPMDISHYNALLRVYIENNHYICTDTFLKELEEKGLEPNRVTYQRLMWNHCQKGDVQKASTILESMRAKNLPLSDAVLDALVLGHAQQGNMEGARSVLEAMGTAGLLPTARTYALLIGGYAKIGDLDGVKKVIEESVAQDIYISDKDLMDVIENSAIAGHSELVTFILDKMRRSTGYNQDAINLIYRLMNQNCHEAAFQVFQSMTRSTFADENNTPTHYGAFFIKHLVKSNSHNDVIVSTCKKLLDNNMAPKAYYIAVEAAMEKQDHDLSIALFNAMKVAGLPIRQHYFWPLLISKNNHGKMASVIRIMVEDFEMNPTVETLRDYVIPNYINSNPNKIIETLRESGVQLSIIVRSMIFYLLNEGKIEDAAAVASVYGTKTNLKVMRNNLLQAFVKQTNVDALVTIVSMSCSEELASKRNNLTEDDVEQNSLDIQLEQKEAISHLLYLLVGVRSDIGSENFVKILEGFLSNNLCISNDYVNKIQDKMGNNITEEIKDLLGKLSSGDLKPTAYNQVSIPNIRRSPQQLESLINNLEQKGENVVGLKKQLLTSYCRTKDVANIEKTMNELEAMEFVLTPGVLAQVIEAYTYVNDIEKVLAIKSKLFESNPDFILDDIKVLKIALLLVNENRFEEAIKMIQETPCKNYDPLNDQDDNRNISRMLAYQILNKLAEQSDPTRVKSMLDILVEKTYIKISNAVLGPLVKANLMSGDVNAALNVFEDCCRLHQCTPFKSELIKKLIMEEDATGLQKLTDLSTVVHGEVNSLYDLVFGFLECNKLKQARRILETPGMRTRNRRLNVACEYYGRIGNIDFLEKLFEVTRELTHIDRTEMFQQLLNYYVKTENTDKALGLWTLMQEESVPSSDQFLITLAEYLQSKEVPVPFAVPSTKYETNSKPITKNGILKESNDHYEQVNFDTFKVFIEEGKFDDANKFVLEKLKSKVFINNSFLKFAISRFSQCGKEEILKEIERYLTPEQKSFVSFDNKKCVAIAINGNSSAYLDELENGIDSAKEDDLKSLEFSFPRGGIFAILSDKNYYQRVKTIIQKYCDRGIVSPMNSLWSYHVLDKNHEEAKVIWDKYLKNSTNSIMFRRIMQVATENDDPGVLPVLVEFLKTNPNVPNGAFASIYSRQIDILIKLDKIHDAQQVFENALSAGISMSNLHENTLNQLKLATKPSKISNTA